MKAFLTATAVLEGITGLILLTFPSVIVSFLLGTSINEPGDLLSRLAGAALISISIICWSYRKVTSNTTGIYKALLFYNLLAGSLLIYSYLTGFSGLGLWPAALQHFTFGIWCIYLLMKKPVSA